MGKDGGWGCQGYFFKTEHVCCWEWSSREGGSVMQEKELMRRVVGERGGDGNQHISVSGFLTLWCVHPSLEDLVFVPPRAHVPEVTLVG